MEVQLPVKYHQRYAAEKDGKKKYAYFDVTETVSFKIPDLTEATFPVAFITKVYDDEKNEVQETEIRYYEKQLYRKSPTTLDKFLNRISRRCCSRSNIKPPKGEYRLTSNDKDSYVSLMNWMMELDHNVVFRSAYGDELWYPCDPPVYKISVSGNNVFLNVQSQDMGSLSYNEFLATERAEALAIAEYWYKGYHDGTLDNIDYHGLINSIEVKMPELCEKWPNIYERCMEAIIDKIDTYLAVFSHMENISPEKKKEILAAQEYRQTLLS